MKMCCLILFILFNSLMVCYVINSFLSIPDTIIKPIQFSFIEDKQHLISEVHFNCYSDSYDLQCINLENTYYQVKLDLELLRKDEMVNNNIELELKILNREREFKIKKLIFIEGYSKIIESFYEMLLFPFKVFGYYNEKSFNIDLLDNYDNNVKLDNIQIILKDKNVNIKRGHMRFVPSVWLIWKIIAYFRIFSIPIFFFSSIVFQILICICVWFIMDKIYAEENGITKLN
jgi:hypothetical protein